MRAKALAITGGSAGVSLVVSGLAFLLAGPTGPSMMASVLLAGIIVGAMLVLMSLVGYFTYMERLEPENYQHETPFETD